MDQICINQEDQTERSEQVLSMHGIYGRASAVCVWLGLPNEDHVYAFDTLRGWTTHIAPFGKSGTQLILSSLRQLFRGDGVWEILSGSLPSERTWTAIHKLCLLPWWRRAWVMQEATGSVQTYAMCGQSWIDFPDLLKVLIAVQPITRLRSFPYPALETTNIYCMLMTLDFRARGQLRVLDALQFLRCFDCKDPRDKVYAVLVLFDMK